MKTVRHATTIGLTCLFAFGSIPQARAFVVNINGTGLFGNRELYLRVGDGAYSGTYTGGGTPGNSATINRVSVSVPANAVGNGSAQAMTSNATQATSFYDGYVFCNLPSQVYIGGYNRGGTLNSATGTLTVTVPASLANASGNTIPFGQISWTSSGNGDTGTQPFPAGTFSGGSTQTLASFPANTWRESCHTFSYANANLVAAGTYTGRVTYTLSLP